MDRGKLLTVLCIVVGGVTAALFAISWLGRRSPPASTSESSEPLLGTVDGRADVEPERHVYEVLGDLRANPTSAPTKRDASTADGVTSRKYVLPEIGAATLRTMVADPTAWSWSIEGTRLEAADFAPPAGLQDRSTKAGLAANIRVFVIDAGPLQGGVLVSMPAAEEIDIVSAAFLPLLAEDIGGTGFLDGVLPDAGARDAGHVKR